MADETEKIIMIPVEESELQILKDKARLIDLIAEDNRRKNEIAALQAKLYPN